MLLCFWAFGLNLWKSRYLITKCLCRSFETSKSVLSGSQTWTSWCSAISVWNDIKMQVVGIFFLSFLRKKSFKTTYNSKIYQWLIFDKMWFLGFYLIMLCQKFGAKLPSNCKVSLVWLRIQLPQILVFEKKRVIDFLKNFPSFLQEC